MIFTFLRSNSGFIRAIYPSSVVQTGVKSLGCENRTAQELSIHSWKRIRPWLVSASKSGAVSPIFIDIFPFSVVQRISASKPERKLNKPMQLIPLDQFDVEVAKAL